MGVLSCMKYLMFIFNVLVFVSPAGDGGVQGTEPSNPAVPSVQSWDVMLRVAPVQGRGPQHCPHEVPCDPAVSHRPGGSAC